MSNNLHAKKLVVATMDSTDASVASSTRGETPGPSLMEEWDVLRRPLCRHSMHDSKGAHDASGENNKPDAWLIQHLVDGEWRNSTPMLEPPPEEWASRTDLRVLPLYRPSRLVFQRRNGDALLRNVLGNLIRAARWWAAQEDGVPGEVWGAYSAACAILGWRTNGQETPPAIMADDASGADLVDIDSDDLELGITLLERQIERMNATDNPAREHCAVLAAARRYKEWQGVLTSAVLPEKSSADPARLRRQF